mmetsp:Transcript_14001/g.16995  ORF Transcript_14001/g.16995 Transcript_14001/m.16995 type:complete len:1107 (-) Transcript_14001:1162-4482(-)
MIMGDSDQMSSGDFGRASSGEDTDGERSSQRSYEDDNPGPYGRWSLGSAEHATGTVLNFHQPFDASQSKRKISSSNTNLSHDSDTNSNDDDGASEPVLKRSLPHVPADRSNSILRSQLFVGGPQRNRTGRLSSSNYRSSKRGNRLSMDRQRPSAKESVHPTRLGAGAKRMSTRRLSARLSGKRVSAKLRSQEGSQQDVAEATRTLSYAERLAQKQKQRPSEAAHKGSFFNNFRKYLSMKKKESSKKKLTRRSYHNFVTTLPRGGVHVNTSIGAIQFGMPPETIKDVLNMGLEKPKIYVVPKERFNLTVGISVAEIEFPTFYNFFILGNPVTLVSYEQARQDLDVVLQEALNGPPLEYLYSNTDQEYRDCTPEKRASCPDHAKELDYFAVEQELINYEFFDEKRYAYLRGENGQQVVIFDNEDEFCFEVFDHQAYLNETAKEIMSDISDLAELDITDNDPLEDFIMARAGGLEYCFQRIDYSEVESCRDILGDNDDEMDTIDELEDSEYENDSDLHKSGGFPRSSILPTRSIRKNKQDVFIIPKFGLTVLGNSHGFDAKGSTTGFVVWINGKGVMVDPPPHSSTVLLEHGIQPKSITAIILTHCHADHDAGTFQKMIRDDKVDLMTSATVFESFTRKYSAVSGLSRSFIQKLVNFRPMFLEEPNYWNGAQFRFFYSLHSIPCVGFEVTYDGKSLVYSGDTFYDRGPLLELKEKGVLSEARAQSLINFPWQCDVVLHEAGVPPIHTPVKAFLELDEEDRRNIRLIHVGGVEAERARKEGFAIAQPGVENSIILRPASEKNGNMMRLLQIISSMEIFEHFSIAKALELVLMAVPKRYKPDYIIRAEKDPIDKFCIITSGTAYARADLYERPLYGGDYFGELVFLPDESLVANIGELVIADTEVETIELDKYALKNLMLEDNTLQEKMLRILNSRIDGSWQAIQANSILCQLGVAQKTYLQSMAVSKTLKKGEIVAMDVLDEAGTIVNREWKYGSPVSFAVLVGEGQLIFDEVHGYGEDMSPEEEEVERLQTGMLLYDYFKYNREGSQSDDPSIDELLGDSGNKWTVTTTLRACTDDTVVFLIDAARFEKFIHRIPHLLLGIFKSPVVLF